MFVDYVRQQLSVAGVMSTNEYAFKSFLSFVRSYGSGLVTRDVLVCWLAELYMKGMKAVSVKRYLCSLHVAYRQWLQEEAARHIGSEDIECTSEDSGDPFDGLLAIASAKYQVEMDVPRYNLGAVKKLVRTDGYAGDRGKWTAIFFYLLYNPGVTPADVAQLTFDAVPRYCPQTVEIAESMNSSHGRKYVFALRQADKRLPGIVRDISDGLSQLLKNAGMRFFGKNSGDFTVETITAMWICAAYAAGVKVDRIRAVVNVIPHGFDILAHVAPADLSVKEKCDIICRVADTINDITTRWYVLNMREKITPGDVKACIAGKFPELCKHVQFFYPTHYSYRESRRKKLVKQEVPFLPGLLFIKMRSDMVGTLFGKITDVAWGYKYANTPESPYSVISQKAMTDFQRHIGVFSEDVKVELVQTAKTFRQGQTVRILRSDLFGKLGEIESVKDSEPNSLYTIQITEDTAMKITVRNIGGMFIENAP